MTVFEYLSVLISIVLALGIAHLLGGLSAIARAWRRVQPYWVYALWAVWVLAIHIQIWWTYWDQSVVAEWTLPRFGAMLVLPGLAYFMARTIIPESSGDGTVDLREHFTSIRVPFFVSVALLWIYAMVWRTAAFGEPLLVPRRGLQAALAILAVVRALTENKRWQGGVVTASIIAWLALVALFRVEIGAGID